MSGRFELVRDKWGNPIQGLYPDPDGVATVAIGAASARVALPSDAHIIRIATSQPCYFKFGDGTVAATGTDSLFPAGSETFRIPAEATHIAVIRDGVVVGTCSITRML